MKANRTLQASWLVRKDPEVTEVNTEEGLVLHRDSSFLRDRTHQLE